MNYQQCIDNIRDLGFSDDDEMEEFGELVPNSINRAITEINLNVAPIIERYEFSLDDTDDGYLYITMPDVDDNFLEFADNPVTYEEAGEEVYKRFSDYDIEAEDTIVVNADNLNGSFRIFYKAAHDDFVWDTDHVGIELPLPLKVHHLVPLLAAYYVWLEDEPAKAAQYYNLFDERKNEYIEQATKPKGTIWAGGI